MHIVYWLTSKHITFRMTVLFEISMLLECGLNMNSKIDYNQSNCKNLGILRSLSCIFPVELSNSFIFSFTVLVTPMVDPTEPHPSILPVFSHRWAEFILANRRNKTGHCFHHKKYLTCLCGDRQLSLTEALHLVTGFGFGGRSGSASDMGSFRFCAWSLDSRSRRSVCSIFQVEKARKRIEVPSVSIKFRWSRGHTWIRQILSTNFHVLCARWIEINK